MLAQFISAGARRGRRRALAAAGSLGATLLLCFALGQWTPGDAFTQLELDPALPAQALAGLRARYLPQRPLAERGWSWLVAAVHGDLGYSLQFHRPVLTILRERAPASLNLMTLGLLLAWAAGLGAALLPAWLGERGARRWRRGLGAMAYLGGSGLAALPIGLLTLLVLRIAQAGWLARPGAPGNAPWLPATVLALAFFPAVYFQAAQALAELRQRPFLRQARAAGIGPWRLLWRHCLPNAADVIIPLAALTVSQALVELVVVETLLSWPGLGQLSLIAALGRDMPVVAALVLVSSLVVIASNLTSDLLQMRWNPRLGAARFAAGAAGEGQEPV